MIVQPSTHRRFHVATKITDPQDLDFHPRRTIEVDLGRTPSRTAWGHVRVDDRGIDAKRVPLPGGPCVAQLTGFHVTSIGGYLAVDSDDLVRGCLVGGVYFEDEYFEQVRDRIDVAGNPWPSDGRKTYQLTSISYSSAAENGPRKSLRYHGFEARLAALRAGTTRRVELFDIYGLTLGEHDLDFGDPLHVDDAPQLAASERALTAASLQDDRGAIYIELARLAELAISNPKLPIGLGD
ncbi:MAG TPA: hypothetical protein VGD80_12540 [Kofleriaceae bacterium]